jgi:hypothetical protein
MKTHVHHGASSLLVWIFLERQQYQRARLPLKTLSLKSRLLPHRDDVIEESSSECPPAPSTSCWPSCWVCVSFLFWAPANDLCLSGWSVWVWSMSRSKELSPSACAAIPTSNHPFRTLQKISTHLANPSNYAATADLEVLLSVEYLSTNTLASIRKQRFPSWL